MAWLSVKAEMDDVPVLLALLGDKIVVANYLCADQALLEIDVNNAFLCRVALLVRSYFCL